MKVATAWWGIELTAETKEEEALLASLNDTLPDKAETDYDEWSHELGSHPHNDFVEYTGLTLTLER